MGSYTCSSYAKPESIDEDDEELEEAALTLGHDCMELLRKNNPQSPLPSFVAIIASIPTANTADDKLDKKATALANK